MKKTLLWVSVVTLLINTAVYLLFFLPSHPLIPMPELGKRRVIYIGVAGPLTDHGGAAMLRGIELYRDKINREGGVDGRKIELLLFDDKDKAEIAESNAVRIADENNVMFILGHYRDDTSVAAGKIYKRDGIPAITASATAESVTYGNEWYFRVIPVNEMEAEFAANYIYRSMKKKSASIIFSTDSYGQAIAGNFEKTAKSLGMEIKKKWAYDRKGNPDEQAKSIVAELKSADKGDILFLAIHSPEGAKLITELKDSKTACPIIGSYAFARTFFNAMKNYPREWSEPGYYSDSIYFLTPFMADIGGIETYRFKQEYIKAYHEPPSDISACYYDAFHVAVQAIKKAGIQGGADHIREDRRKIRETLAGFYSKETAVSGITGPIYFDGNGDVRKHYAVGRWWKQKEIPALSQYRQTADTETVDETAVKQILDGDILLIKDTVMNKIRIVYAGIDNIKLGIPDIKRSECEMAFDIRFRYTGIFDDANIEFTNAVSPISLEKAVKEETDHNITTRVYHVKGKFKLDFDFRVYPFDSQVIPVRFHHAVMTDDRMIYFPDTLELPRPPDSKIPGWDVKDVSLYQDVAVKDSNLGNPKFFDSPHRINYSQFNAEIVILRQRDFTVAAYFFQIAAMLILLYGIYFIRPDRLLPRVIIPMVILTFGVCSRLISLIDFSAGYMVSLDYIFFTVYILIILSVPLSLYIYRLHREGKDRKMKFLIYAGRIAYPCVLLAMGTVFFYLR
jgi:branched-chain amino acid transport system substrate-binding protein